MFQHYFQDELQYLRDLGREFAEEHPGLAQHLTSRGSDPDVERLLEGFAFLTARVRQKLDDDLPELTHSLLQLLFPHYLRPLPAATVVRMKPKVGAVRDRLVVPRGTRLRASGEGTDAARFRTCYPVELLPLEVEALRLERRAAGDAVLRLGLRAQGDVDLGQVDLSRLRLHLAGDDDETARALLRVLLLEVDEARVAIRSRKRGSEPKELRLPSPRPVLPVGFEYDGVGGPSSLLPGTARTFPGYQLLQEYFFFPAKFHFVDIDLRVQEDRGLLHGHEDVDGFELAFHLRALPEGFPELGRGHVELFCTPAVNLFEQDADPLQVDHRRAEYLLRPQGTRGAELAIFSVDAVETLEPDRRAIPCFDSLDFPQHDALDGVVYYETRLRPSRSRRGGAETWLRFRAGNALSTAGQGVDATSWLPPTELVQVRLTCTNHELPPELGAGDVCLPGEKASGCATYSSVYPVVPTVAPPLHDDLHWRLVSHLSLNYLSLASAPALRGLLGTYDFQAKNDEQAARASRKRLEAILDVRAEHDDGLVRGAPVRGLHTTVTVDERGFSGEGDVYLFGCMLERFLAQYVAANSFSRMTLVGRNRGARVRFPRRAGEELLL